MKAHYVYIKDLSRLVRDQLTKHKNHHFICERCFYHTENLEIFRRHQDIHSISILIVGTKTFITFDWVNRFEFCFLQIDQEMFRFKFNKVNLKRK
jgi:hypothetical protein